MNRTARPPHALVAVLTAVTVAVLGLPVLAAGRADAGQAAQPTLVSEVPATTTPQVRDGRVHAIAVVGATTLLGGSFTSATDPAGGAAVATPYVLAYSTATGALVRSFTPRLDGAVETIAAGPYPGTAYVGGRFATAAGAKAKGLVLIDTTTGARLTSFVAPPMNGVVDDVAVAGGRLWIAGTFTLLGPAAHGGLAALSPTSGAVDAAVTTTVLTNHNWTPGSTGARAAVGVSRIDVTPDGRRMVAIGNFRTVDGLPRDQVAVLDLSVAGATVAADWATTAFDQVCYSWDDDSWVRDVEMSPDGAWFVVASSGGGNEGPCDATTRWETWAHGTAQTATWKASTGGDSMLSVSVTAAAVYIGGHQRWMDNDTAVDRAGPGAVARPGLGAVDPDTGVPLAWNPGRNPRGAGAEVLLATPDALLVGSDTEWIGNRRYKRARIASFPLAGGRPVAGEGVYGLPGGVYLGRTVAGSSTLVRRDLSSTGAISAQQALAGAGAGAGVDWSAFRAAALVGGRLWAVTADGRFVRRTFDGTTVGPEVAVNPYSDPTWDGVPTGSYGTVFTGSPTSFYDQLGQVTSLFGDGPGGRLFYTLAGSGTVYYRAFSTDSGIVGPVQLSVPSGTVRPDLTDAFLAGSTLFTVGPLGGLWRYPFSLASVGAGTLVSGPDVDGRDWRAGVVVLGPGGTP